MVGFALLCIFAFIWVVGAVYSVGERWFLEWDEADRRREEGE